MKNLWHIIILFMLPGLVIGGNTIAAFYRLTDGTLEQLAALCAAGAVWSISAYTAVLIKFIRSNTSQLYYPAQAITAALFVLAAGSAVIFCGNGTIGAMTGIAISGAATAWTAQSFTAGNIRVFDRWIFIAGAIASGMIWAVAGLGSRLAWMETLFFYLAILLLLTWAFASPLTCRGSRIHRWLWRTAAAGCAIGGFYLAPVFSPPPPAALTAPDTGKLWSKTYTSCNGRRFILQDSSGKQDLYTPQGRLLMPYKADENLQAAALALLNISNTPRPAVQLITLYTSVLPRCYRQSSNARVRQYRLPAAMRFRKFSWKKPGIQHLIPLYDIQKTYKNAADIVLLTALPENQYPAFLNIFLQYTVLDSIADNGIAAVPSHLLKNPAVFRFMHENFPYSGVLPAPGDLWVFSKKTLDLSIKNISRNMQNNLDGYTNATSEMFEILYSSPVWNNDSIQYQPAENIKYGNNRLTGSWWWLIIGCAAVILWRTLRLFGERRNIMYSCFNAVENGFSGMGAFLLILSLLLINNGANALFIAITAISFVFFLAKWNIGGVWVALAGLILLLIAICIPGRIELYLPAVMIQTAGLTGRLPSAAANDIRSEQQMLHAVFAGMMAASLFICAVWLFNMPLLLAWAVIFAARIPGIWQYSRIGVYYNK